MMYRISKKKLLSLNIQLFASVVLLLLTYLFPTHAMAEEITLGVSPAILQIESIPPSDVRAPFTVENLSNKPIKLKLGYRLFKAGKENGQIEYLRDKDPFPGANKTIFENIQVIDDNISVDSLELGPKQSKKLSLRIILPKNEPFSDYYFSLIFLAEPEDPESENDNSSENSQNSFSSSQAGIAMNVLLSVGPKENDKGYIENFSGPFYVESGPYEFSLLVKNAGSQYITPKGTILIKNMFGHKIGKVEIAPDNILSGSSRSLTDIISAKSNQETNNSYVIWGEEFLLGFYDATLTLSMSENGPVYSRTIHFIAFPAKLLLGIVIAIIVLLFAYLRIKKGLSSE